jgi:hypothetical protein
MIIKNGVFGGTESVIEVSILAVRCKALDRNTGKCSFDKNSKTFKAIIEKRKEKDVHIGMEFLVLNGDDYDTLFITRRRRLEAATSLRIGYRYRITNELEIKNLGTIQLNEHRDKICEFLRRMKLH